MSRGTPENAYELRNPGLAGHLLEYLAQLPLGTEHVVYIGADARDG